MNLLEAPLDQPLRVLRFRDPAGNPGARAAKVIGLSYDEPWDQWVHEGDKILLVDRDRNLVEVLDPDTEEPRRGLLVVFEDLARSGTSPYELTEVEMWGPQWN